MLHIGRPRSRFSRYVHYVTVALVATLVIALLVAVWAAVLGWAPLAFLFNAPPWLTAVGLLVDIAILVLILRAR